MTEQETQGQNTGYGQAEKVVDETEHVRAINKEEKAELEEEQAANAGTSENVRALTPDEVAELRKEQEPGSEEWDRLNPADKVDTDRPGQGEVFGG